jgi:hypothetical protein
MDDETKKVTCTDDCTCKCNIADCGCCEKKDVSDADADPEAEPADEEMA